MVMKGRHLITPQLMAEVEDPNKKGRGQMSNEVDQEIGVPVPVNTQHKIYFRYEGIHT